MLVALRQGSLRGEKSAAPESYVGPPTRRKQIPPLMLVPKRHIVSHH